MTTHTVRAHRTRRGPVRAYVKRKPGKQKHRCLECDQPGHNALTCPRKVVLP